MTFEKTHMSWLQKFLCQNKVTFQIYFYICFEVYEAPLLSTHMSHYVYTYILVCIKLMLLSLFSIYMYRYHIYALCVRSAYVWHMHIFIYTHGQKDEQWARRVEGRERKEDNVTYRKFHIISPKDWCMKYKRFHVNGICSTMVILPTFQLQRFLIRCTSMFLVTL